MPTTVILTSFMHQRGGDLVAATSFMKAILQQSPHMKFEWIIKRDISSYQKDLSDFLKKELGDQSQLVDLTVIDSADYNDVTITPNGVLDKQTQKILSSKALTERSDANWGTVSTGWFGWKDIHQKIQSKPIADKISSADAIAVIGNPHRLIKNDHRVLHDFGKKIITVPEYSLYHTNNTVYFKGDLIMSTGFDQLERGIYIDNTVKSTDGFEKIDTSDISFLNHLIHPDGTQKDSYHAKTQLFYGYFFDNESLTAKNYTVQAESYIQNVIKLAIDRGEKPNIDIVIPGFINPDDLQRIYETALKSLPPEYINTIRTARYDVKSSEEYTCNSLIDTKDPSKLYEIRLINPKRLQRSTIQSLLNESDPFIGLTGDASWVEGLMKGKVTCYQTMQWKKSFYDGFLHYLETKDFLKNSPLLRFYKLQAPNSKSSASCWEEMRALYLNHKDEMLADSKILAGTIESEKDINKNLIPEFIKLVLAQEQHEKAQETKTLTQLITLCENYKKHLHKPLHHNYSDLVNKKLIIVDSMLNALKSSTVPDSKIRIKNLEAILTKENKSILSCRRDSSEGAKFLEGILNILIICVYSKISKGTFAFWKSHGEAVVDKIEALSPKV